MAVAIFTTSDLPELVLLAPNFEKKQCILMSVHCGYFLSQLINKNEKCEPRPYQHLFWSIHFHIFRFLCLVGFPGYCDQIRTDAHKHLSFTNIDCLLFYIYKPQAHILCLNNVYKVTDTIKNSIYAKISLFWFSRCFTAVL